MREKILAIALGLALLASAFPAAGEEEQIALYQENERAHLLVARLTGSTTEGAGILFHVDDRHVYGITAKHVVFQQGRKLENLDAIFQAWPGKRLRVKVPNVHYQEDL